MTKRKPVSAIKNVWFDSQQVGEEDLTTEQAANDQIASSLINNHIGTGVLPETLVQNVLLDTEVSKVTAGTLDGKPIVPQLQPSDAVSGCQLELDLVDSAVAGRKTIKVAVIGLDFNGNLQYDTFTFSKNEKQVTAKHYTRILSVLFNDMLGVVGRSFNLGGRLFIREASPFTLSRQPTMVGQTVEPNLFFRDFFLDGSYSTLSALLQAAASGFNIDALDISTSYKQLRKLVVNDVTTQIGQKFKAETTNIQKISLMLGVENTITPADLTWGGDLVVSIYALQSSVSSPSEIVPELAIDFTPSNLPLAQVSFNFTTLQNNGVVLDGYLQPVDFVFSNTPVATGSLTVGNYYAVTVKRSGSADKCNILMPVGSDRLDDSRLTIFNGTTWVDVQEEDLWFEVHTDSGKVSDGQAYDAGQGIYLPKTKADTETGSTIDYSLGHLSFSTTLPFYAVLQAETELSNEVQDQRTGNPIKSRQQLVPDVNIVNSTELTRLKNVGEPLVLGSIQDKNIKSIDAGNSTVSSSFYHFGMFKNKAVIKLNEVNGDPANNLHVLTALLNGDLVEAKFTPNNALPNTFYRIAKAEALTMIYGDVNGDGIVDESDADMAATLLAQSVSTSPTATEYQSSTNFFTTSSPVSYQLKLGNTVIASGTGQLTVDPVDGTVAKFKDVAYDFSVVNNLLSCDLVLSGSSSNNNGTFEITVLTATDTLQIKKFYRDTDMLLRILRTDISGDGYVGSDDIASIGDYVLGVQPIPAVTSPENRIGTPFRALVLTLEDFIDRNDDYPNNLSTRATDIHTDPDIVAIDATFANHNFSSPIPFVITKRLTWRSDLIAVSPKVKAVPAVFTEPTFPPPFASEREGITAITYPVIAEIDPGRNDVFAPANLVLGGQIVTPEGKYFKVDYEVGTIVLNIPIIDFPDEKSINLFTDFVADFNGNGTTRLGYPAMRFADNSFITNPLGLQLNQARFAVGIQSFYPELDGLSTDGYEGVIVDDKMGVYLDPVTGILKLNFSHLKEELAKLTLTTKVEITVFLKKGGFNNNTIVVDSAKMANLLGLS